MAPIRSRKEHLELLGRLYFGWSVTEALVLWSHVPLIGKIGLVLLVGSGYFVARKYGRMKGFLAGFRQDQGKTG